MRHTMCFDGLAMSTKVWIPAAIAVLFAVGACTSSVADPSGDPQSDPPSNHPACPSAEPTGADDMVACPEDGLACRYPSGPCDVGYLCRNDVWHHQSAACTPMAVPWDTAKTGDVCAFVGEEQIEQGNCTDTWTCEPDHTWKVVFGFAPDGYPCP